MTRSIASAVGLASQSLSLRPPFIEDFRNLTTNAAKHSLLPARQNPGATDLKTVFSQTLINLEQRLREDSKRSSYAFSVGKWAFEPSANRLVNGHWIPSASTVAILTKGEFPSYKLTQTMLGRIRDINPDQIVFVGRQLAKKEIVEYLSALSRTAHVRVVIGSDANGDNQLYH